jgi:hypothetical protein
MLRDDRSSAPSPTTAAAAAVPMRRERFMPSTSSTGRVECGLSSYRQTVSGTNPNWQQPAGVSRFDFYPPSPFGQLVSRTINRRIGSSRRQKYDSAYNGRDRGVAPLIVAAAFVIFGCSFVCFGVDGAPPITSPDGLYTANIQEATGSFHNRR